MKKALIFYGGWNGHTPKETSELFRDWLTEAGFAVTMADNLNVLDNYDDIKDYDLFVPMFTMSEISGQQCGNICRAVAEGAGIAGCHGGMCDSFRNSTDWQFMTGAQWVAHPGGIVDYTVEVDPESPFCAGLNGFAVTSEQYYIHVDPAATVHATTTFKLDNGPHYANGEVTVPVVITKMWGKGRVFYNSLGHTWETFSIPEAKEIMLRGLLWAART